jgi:hypothetical protein
MVLVGLFGLTAKLQGRTRTEPEPGEILMIMLAGPSPPSERQAGALLLHSLRRASTSVSGGGAPLRTSVTDVALPSRSSPLR